MKVAGAGVDLMIRSFRDCHEVLRSHEFAGSAGRPEGRAFLGEYGGWLSARSLAVDDGVLCDERCRAVDAPGVHCR